MTFVPGDVVTIDPAHPRWADPQLAVLWSDMRLTVEGEPGALFVAGRKGARHTLAADGRCGFVRVGVLGAAQEAAGAVLGVRAWDLHVWTLAAPATPLSRFP